MPKIVVSFSGGMDSLTLLGFAISEFGRENVIPVGFSYGSKHNQWEHRAAQMAVGFYDVSYSIIPLDFVKDMFKSDLLQSGGEIPEGHYEAESMKRTVVPCRNLIFASILAGFAESEGAERVYLGVHAGDHAIYPDCRAKFIYQLCDTVLTATEGKVKVAAPFLHVDKAEILRIGLKTGVPYNFSRTCYKDQPVACGKCGSCQERLAAFEEVGMTDPLEYESREILPKS
jgi:7-cyano-7-deazaguanine synthase